MIGICTRYSRHEATYVALRLADWFESHGQPVAMHACAYDNVPVDPRWDQQVSRSLFTTWVAKNHIKHIFMTFVPSLSTVDWIKQNGISLHIIPLWHELEAGDQERLKQATAVYAMHESIFRFLREWAIRDVVLLPWDSGEPVFRKSEIPTKSIYLPLYDGTGSRYQGTLLSVLARLLSRHRDLEVTVAYTSSSLVSAVKLALRRLAKVSAGRLHVIKRSHPKDRPAEFSRHALTLWPTEFESTCLVGLSSVTMGTPVVTFAVPPVTDCLTDEESVMLTAPISAKEHPLRIPKAYPDYANLYEHLDVLVNDVEFIMCLQSATVNHAKQRRDRFDTIMEQCDLK